MSKCYSFLYCILLACMTGCGNRQASVNYDVIDLVDVSGNITLNGQPLAGAVVSFTDEESSRMSYGITDANGSYRLNFDKQKMGVTPGSKIVKVSTATLIEGINDDGVKIDEETGESKVKEQAPPQYNTKSELRAVVEPGNHEFDFSLTSSAQ